MTKTQTEQAIREAVDLRIDGQDAKYVDLPNPKRKSRIITSWV